MKNYFLREIRKICGMPSQKDFANSVGFLSSYICQLEIGAYPLSLKTAEKYSKHLGIHLHEFFYLRHLYNKKETLSKNKKFYSCRPGKEISPTSKFNDLVTCMKSIN